jgi:hypothetical protein
VRTAAAATSDDIGLKLYSRLKIIGYDVDCVAGSNPSSGANVRAFASGGDTTSYSNAKAPWGNPTSAGLQGPCNLDGMNGVVWVCHHCSHSEYSYNAIIFFP